VRMLPVPPSSPGSVALTKLGQKQAVAWADLRSSTRDVLLLALDGSGAATGNIGTISTESNADGVVDIVADDFGAAAVFGVRLAGVRGDVRFRPIDLTGKPSGPERVISEALEQGSDPSILPFSGGYAIAYRSLHDTDAEIRLALVDVLGSVLSRLFVAPASQ